MCGGPTLQESLPRPLRIVNGEVLVARTIRLLRYHDIIDIAISSTDVRFERFGVPVLKHDNKVSGDDCHWLQCFYPTDEPVCYLMGDVYYSDNAISTIINTRTDDIEFFASAPPFSPYYIKPFGEPFAFKVQNQKRFRGCIEETLRYEAEGKFRREVIAWELWQVIKGTELNLVQTNYTVINDYTVDVDSDKQTELLEKKLKQKFVGVRY